MAGTNKRGIFTLFQVKFRQNNENWTSKNDVWLNDGVGLYNWATGISPVTSMGYWGGGYTGSQSLSTVDRIDFSNDTATASVRGPLIANRYKLAGTGNNFYGYFGGGINPGISPSYTSTVDRINYANDTALASLKGPLSAARQYVAAVSTTSYGYFAGGRNPPSNFSTVDRIDYSNDTPTATPKGPLSAARNYLSGTGNQAYGYIGTGGASAVDRIDYANDTATASPKGNLVSYFFNGAATGNSSYGYWGGGIGPAYSPSRVSIVSRLDYANDTAQALSKGPLSSTKYSASAAGNSSYGYFGGGGPPISTVDRIDYSNDTPTASVRGPLAEAKAFSGATSPQSNALPQNPQGYATPTYGYYAGSPGAGYTIDRIDFSNDSAIATPRGALTRAAEKWGAVGNLDYGYFAGGGPGIRSDLLRIDYSNDNANVTTRGNLSINKYYHSGVGNNSYGWFGGAQSNAGTITTIDRVNFANDTATASVRSSMQSGHILRYGASGNLNYGYFGGGSGPGAKSLVSRIDYANDTTTAASKGPLSATKYSPTGTGNADYGWFAGGYSSPTTFSTVDRIDYSNDSVTASPKGPMTEPIWRSGAVSSPSYGWWGGGAFNPGSPTRKSFVQRVDWSNDTVSSSIRGPLTTEREDHAGISPLTNALPAVITSLPPANNPSQSFPTTWYGYFGYGPSTNPNVPAGTIERMDFTNDTPTASIRGSLNNNLSGGAATGNSSYGWFGGGYSPASSVVDRIDYSNDTATASVRGPLSLARAFLAASSNTSYGWYSGGYDWGAAGPNGQKSTVDRIDWSNDSVAASVRGPLSSETFYVMGTGNANYGWHSGGNVHRSRIDRIDYSNDTPQVTTRGPLTANKYGGGATGNADYGWYGGGSPYPYRSSIDRVDYSNDTATATPRGPLTGGRGYIFSATGDASYGYWAAGQITIPERSSAIERVDYSNDTVTASVRGPLNAERSYMTATSAAANGLPQ